MKSMANITLILVIVAIVVVTTIDATSQQRRRRRPKRAKRTPGYMKSTQSSRNKDVKVQATQAKKARRKRPLRVFKFRPNQLKSTASNGGGGGGGRVMPIPTKHAFFRVCLPRTVNRGGADVSIALRDKPFCARMLKDYPTAVKNIMKLRAAPEYSQFHAMQMQVRREQRKEAIANLLAKLNRVPKKLRELAQNARERLAQRKAAKTKNILANKVRGKRMHTRRTQHRGGSRSQQRGSRARFMETPVQYETICRPDEASGSQDAAGCTSYVSSGYCTHPTMQKYALKDCGPCCARHAAGEKSYTTQKLYPNGVVYYVFAGGVRPTAAEIAEFKSEHDPKEAAARAEMEASLAGMTETQQWRKRSRFAKTWKFNFAYEWKNKGWTVDYETMMIPGIDLNAALAAFELRAIEAMHLWEKRTCVRFRVARTEAQKANALRFLIEHGNIGSTMISTRRLSSDIYSPIGIIAHELGHVLGLHHTQKRADMEKYITLVGEAATDPQWKPMGVEADFPDTKFDFGSIMMYPQTLSFDMAAAFALYNSGRWQEGVPLQSESFTIKDPPGTPAALPCMSPDGQEPCHLVAYSEDVQDGKNGKSMASYCENAKCIKETKLGLCDSAAVGEYVRRDCPQCCSKYPGELGSFGTRSTEKFPHFTNSMKHNCESEKCVRWATEGHCDRNYVKRDCRKCCAMVDVARQQPATTYNTKFKIKINSGQRSVPTEQDYKIVNGIFQCAPVDFECTGEGRERCTRAYYTPVGNKLETETYCVVPGGEGEYCASPSCTKSCQPGLTCKDFVCTAETPAAAATK